MGKFGDPRGVRLVEDESVREKLLFIGYSLPFFDRTSGDFRLFTILSILSKSYDITYLAMKGTRSNLSGQERYVSSLKNLGIRLFEESDSFQYVLRENTFKAAFIEFYYVAEYYLKRIKLLQPSCPVIIDTVDVHCLRMHRKYNISKDVNDLKLAEEIKKRELAIYDQADVVLTVTNEDAMYLKNNNPKMAVRIVPNIHPVVYPKTHHNRNDIIFVGGFKHDPNIDAVVYFCRDIFPRIREVIPEARFIIVGSNPPEQITSLSNEFITVTGYVPDTTPYLQKSRVSVAPLRYGAGMKGKIGEAMAHGVPVVTTSIGAEGMGLTHGENILIADSPEIFSKNVIELMHDNGLYEKLRKNSLAHIEENYTPDKIGQQIRCLLEELKGIPVRKLTVSEKASFMVDYAFSFVKRKFPIFA